MKKKENITELELAKKIRYKEIGYFILLAAGLSAIFTVVFMCLTYNGTFTIKGMAGVALWVVGLLIFFIAFLGSNILFGTDKKTATVMGVLLILSTSLSAIVLKYLSLYYALLTLSSLLAVLVLSKKEALVIDFLSTVYLLLLVYCYNTFGNPISDYSVIFPLIIKAVLGIFVICFYKSTFNRLKVIVTGMMVGVLAFAFTLVVDIFAFDVPFVECLMHATWMMLAEISATVLSLLLTPLLEWAFKLETSMQFLEYLTFDQPLLKELAEKAPGTFNHCVQVGNLAERCAYAIGENVNMAKAAAYFHDIGKMQSPEFFTENQDGYNPHDDLIFETSVKIITRHTDKGYEILTQHKFPKIICDVAREHHGDSPLSYFYIKAQNITEGDVDSSDYCYPGPRPTTRISAIVMIADSVEAASRSMNMRDRDALIRLVDKIIRDKREGGQFDDCDITMKQLAIIRDTLVESLVGFAHTRISYPTKK